MKVGIFLLQQPESFCEISLHLFFPFFFAISLSFFLRFKYPSSIYNEGDVSRPLPNRPFELQNPSHDVPDLRKIRQSPDFVGIKLWKVRSGSPIAGSQGRRKRERESRKYQELSQFLFASPPAPLHLIAFGFVCCCCFCFVHAAVANIPFS